MTPVDPQNPSVGQFGPQVIGEKAAAEEAAYLEKSEDIYGPLVMASHPSQKGLNVMSDAVQEGRDPHAPGAEAPEVSLSIKELELELEANPNYVPRLYKAEIARPEGPRKGALQALIKAARPGSDAFVAEVEGVLEDRFPEPDGEG